MLTTAEATAPVLPFPAPARRPADVLLAMGSTTCARALAQHEHEGVRALGRMVLGRLRVPLAAHRVELNVTLERAIGNVLDLVPAAERDAWIERVRGAL